MGRASQSRRDAKSRKAKARLKHEAMKPRPKKMAGSAGHPLVLGPGLSLAAMSRLIAEMDRADQRGNYVFGKGFL